MEGLGINLPSLVAQVVNFVLLMVILRAFLYRPILSFLDRRAERIKASLEAADRMREESSRAEGQVRLQLEEARREGQALLAQAADNARRYEEEQRVQAEARAEGIIARARDEIAAERESAIEGVRAQFAGLAVTAAERIVEERLDVATHRRVIDRVLDEAGLARGGRA